MGHTNCNRHRIRAWRPLTVRITRSTSLKIFLAALAIIDDLGAVIVIALFYTADLNLIALTGVALVWGNLFIFNKIKVKVLWPYLVLGAVLWVLVFASGVHATLAGVMLALTIPLKLTPGTPEATKDESPLHRLEHALHKPVAFIIVPIFGFANAGVSLSDLSLSVFSEPLTMGVAGSVILTVSSRRKTHKTRNDQVTA